MAVQSGVPKKTPLDSDLKKFVRLEKAARRGGILAGKLGLGVLFLLAVSTYLALTSAGIDGAAYVVAAGVIGGYMALNIGANDVANNMGPAVGAKALTMVGALVIAAVFEAAGAILAGSDVVGTISKGIIDISAMPDTQSFIWAMMAALLAAAVWVNLATWVGAPVSTTHAIVGGVLGGGIAAASAAAVDWPVMAKIAASWMISPVIGGIVAAAFLGAIKLLVIYREDRIAAARTWVPVFVAIMAATFAVYLCLKGLKHVLATSPAELALLGGLVFAASWALMRPLVVRASRGLENKRKAVATLFTVPLICSTALLSFAHGANDVANAVGPLAAVVNAVTNGGVTAEVTVPLWVLVVGALGLSAGLMLFGPKLIRTVGEKITRLDPIRAYAVALSAAITVIIASWLGMPVSTTHIAVGGIFGVGFLREYLANAKHARHHKAALAAGSSGAIDKKKLKKARKRKLVRRRYLFTIIAAWIVTVPSAAVLSAGIYFMLRGMLLP